MTRPLSPATLQRLADRIADPMPADRKPRTRSQLVRALIFQVADAYGLTVDQIKSQSRHSLTVEARLEVYWRLRTEMHLSFPAIGRLVGGRDHSTVWHGVKEYEARVDAQRTGQQ